MAERRVDILVRARDRASKILQRVGRSLAALTKRVTQFSAIAAGAAVAGLAAMTRHGLDTVDALAKLAKRTGGNIEQLRGLQRAAELTGASSDKLEAGLEAMQKRLGQAAQGTGRAKDALEALGIELDTIIGLSPSEQFKLLADRIGTLETATEQQAIAAQLFSRSNQQLVQTLKLGADELERITAETTRFAGELDEVDAARVEAANDAWTNLETVISGVSQRLAVDMAPEIKSITDEITDFVQNTLPDLATGVAGIFRKTVEESNKLIEDLRRIKDLTAEAQEQNVRTPSQRATDILEFVPQFQLIQHAMIPAMRATGEGLAEITVGATAREVQRIRNETREERTQQIREEAERQRRQRNEIARFHAQNAIGFSDVAFMLREGMGQPVDETIGQARGRLRSLLDDVRQRFEEVTRPAEGAAASVMQHRREQASDELKKFADRLRETTRTPLERFKEQVERINEAARSGLINQRTAERAMEQARERLEDAQQRAQQAEQDGAADRVVRSGIIGQQSRFLQGVGATSREQAMLDRERNQRLRRIEQHTERTADFLAERNSGGRDIEVFSGGVDQ